MSWLKTESCIDICVGGGKAAWQNDRGERFGSVMVAAKQIIRQGEKYPR